MMTLSELNSMVGEILTLNFTGKYWVQAEISEMRESPKGYCFMELVEKNRNTGEAYAKARAMIPRNIYPMLRLNFETVTEQRLAAGLNVLVQAAVSFHEVYGYSLVIHDINPTYTMGSMVMRRKEIMERLEKEGVADMNKELELPFLLQRIAIVSSPTAAGYEDFCNELDHNIYGYAFHYALFSAMMQGKDTEKSIISALDSLMGSDEPWDAVVVIRGGGAVSDLNWFDSYALANHCAQFPLPVLTGIGHERDVCVLDMVANRHFKTPTAVAAFLVERMRQRETELDSLERTLEDKAEGILDEALRTVQRCADRLEAQASLFLPKREMFLQHLYEKIMAEANHRIEVADMGLEALHKRLWESADAKVRREEQRLRMTDSVVRAYLPENILKKGYSLTLKDGKAVRDAQDVKAGDRIETWLQKGKITSIVE